MAKFTAGQRVRVVCAADESLIGDEGVVTAIGDGLPIRAPDTQREYLVLLTTGIDRGREIWACSYNIEAI